MPAPGQRVDPAGPRRRADVARADHGRRRRPRRRAEPAAPGGRPGMSDSPSAGVVPLEVEDGIAHDPARPAADEPAQRRGAERSGPRRPWRPGQRRDVAGVVVYGGEKVFAAGADIKEMQPMSYIEMVEYSGALQELHPRGRPDPQADGRRHDGVCVRWRVRGRPRVRLPRRRQERQARPAGDPPRHHPRRRWHPAAGPARGTGQGQGHHLLRPVRVRRRGARDRARRRGRRGRGGVCRREGAARAVRRRTGIRDPRGQGGHRPGARDRPRHRSGDRADALQLAVRDQGPRRSG